MSTFIQQRAWRWITISAAGAALAALLRLARRGRGYARRPASRSSDEAAEAALAGGAMSNEGGPARNA